MSSPRGDIESIDGSRQRAHERECVRACWQNAILGHPELLSDIQFRFLGDAFITRRIDSAGSIFFDVISAPGRVQIRPRREDSISWR
jgi:hypothetical protein